MFFRNYLYAPIRMWNQYIDRNNYYNNKLIKEKEESTDNFI